jgi:hypothetical protein
MAHGGLDRWPAGSVNGSHHTQRLRRHRHRAVKMRERANAAGLPAWWDVGGAGGPHLDQLLPAQDLGVVHHRPDELLPVDVARLVGVRQLHGTAANRQPSGGRLARS